MKKSGVTFLAISWVCGTLFFWWLTCKMKPQFLGAAVLAGLVSAMALARITVLAKLAASFEPRWFWLLCRRLVPKIFTDLALLSRVLVRALVGGGGTGTFRAIPFHHGGADARSTARRALVFGGMSLPPNTFAISMHGKDELLEHQLAFTPESADKEWPL